MTPADPKQDIINGPNRVITAKACRYQYRIGELPNEYGFDSSWINKYEVFVQTAMSEWGDRSELLKVEMFSTTSWELLVIDDVIGDVIRMVVSLVLVTIYSLFVLGSCSPVHFRMVTALIGLSCVLLATTAGYGMSFAAGKLISRLHGFLPFMLLGLGVDDMFVIVNTIDQTPMHLPADVRFRVGLAHAGASITLTSVTDAFSFFVGSFTEIPAIHSFCIFSMISVLTIYFSFLTIFAPWFLEDMRRMHKRDPDCFGLFCCGEDSLFCCKGNFLTNRQRNFSGLKTTYEMEVLNKQKDKDPIGPIKQK